MAGRGRIVRQPPNSGDLPGLLGLASERRREDAPTHDADERSPVHYWMISSALTRKDCGIVSPRALAVFRLITNSNLVGCSTGRSPGFAPRRILSVSTAALRQSSGRLGAYDIKPPATTRFDRPRTVGTLLFFAASTTRGDCELVIGSSRTSTASTFGFVIIGSTASKSAGARTTRR